MSACPVDALHRNASTGAIAVNDKACIRCGRCAEVCPHGGIHLVLTTNVPLICDLCGGDPECVKACIWPAAVRMVARGEEEDRKPILIDVKMHTEDGTDA